MRRTRSRAGSIRRRSTWRVAAVLSALTLVMAACTGDGTAEVDETEGAGDVQEAGQADEPDEADVPGSGPPAGAPEEAMAREPAAEVVGDAIKIGVITVTEGSPFADNGRRALQGIEYAAEEINAAGGVAGVPIELVIRDTRGEIEAVADIVRELVVSENVLAILGPVLSGECDVGCPLANELETVTLSPGVGQPGVVEEAGPLSFTLVMPDPVHTAMSLTPVLEEHGFETAALLMDEEDPVSAFMGEAFWPSFFDDAGIEVLDVLTFTSGDQDFSAQATQIGAADPDVIAMAAGPADAARFASELRRQGLDTQLIGSGGLQSAGGDFIAAGEDAVENTITAAQFNDNPDEGTPERALIDGFEATAGDEVTLNSAYGYDALYMLVDVIKREGVTNDPANLAEDRLRVQEGLPALQDWIGMGGVTSINPDGTVDRPAQIGTIQDGRFVVEVVGG